MEYIGYDLTYPVIYNIVTHLIKVNKKAEIKLT